MESDAGSSNVDVKRSADLGGIATAQSGGEPGASDAPTAVDHGGRDAGGIGAAQSGGVPGAYDAPAADPLAHMCLGSQGATFACNGLLQIHGSVLGAAVPLSAVLQLAKEHFGHSKSATTVQPAEPSTGKDMSRSRSRSHTGGESDICLKEGSDDEESELEIDFLPDPACDDKVVGATAAVGTGGK